MSCAGLEWAFFLLFYASWALFLVARTRALPLPCGAVATPLWL